VDWPVLLVGVGVYTGKDEDLFDPENHITFDRSTTTVRVYEGDQMLTSAVVVVDTAKAREEAKAPGRIPNMSPVWLMPPCELEASSTTEYSVEHSLMPTDVTNHYSGFPITKLGAELWTCYGDGGRDREEVAGVKFSFGASSRGGRCCLGEGQLPLLYFWPL
jgi:hypothetical protein